MPGHKNANVEAYKRHLVTKLPVRKALVDVYVVRDLLLDWQPPYTKANGAVWRADRTTAAVGLALPDFGDAVSVAAAQCRC